MSEKASTVESVLEAVAPKTGRGATRDLTSYQADLPRDASYGEFFGFTSERDVFSFTTGGQPTSRRLKFLEEPARARQGEAASVIQRYQHSLPFSFGREKFLPLPAGLTVISGSTAAGKSTFVRAMARVAPNISRVLAVEPPDDGAELNSVPIFSTADGALCGCILGSYRNPESLYVIDSLRAPLFETSGPASKNGIIMPFFTQLTRVSNALARSGISVVATVNPMDEDPAFVKGFLAKLSASVPAVVLLEKNDISQGFETFTGIAAVRPKRAPVSFQLTVRARGGEVAQLPDLISEMTLDPVNPFQDIGHANNPMINAIQKEVI